jgi:hypothetical protein
MKRIIVLGMLCLILLAACAPPSNLAIVSEEDVVSKSNCQRITSYVRACEFRLLDGTLCVVAYTGNTSGGAGVSCDWK